MSRDDDRPNAGMTYTTNLLNFIYAWEDCPLRCYQDGGGVWTIGPGLTGPEIDALASTPCPEMTQAEVDEMARERLDALCEQIVKLVHVPLEQHQLDAVLAFCWNVGIGAFTKSSMLRCMNSAQMGLAAAQFPLWVYDNGHKVRGLERRRIAEMAMFKFGDYEMRP